MSRSLVPKDTASLLRRARAVKADIHDVLQQVHETRQQAQAILEEARQVHPDDAWAHLSPAPQANPRVNTPPQLSRHVSSDEDYQAAAKEVLQAFRTVLTGFPLRWQVHVVKVLTAHILAAGKEHIQPPTALSA